MLKIKNECSFSKAETLKHAHPLQSAPHVRINKMS